LALFSFLDLCLRQPHHPNLKDQEEIAPRHHIHAVITGFYEWTTGLSRAITKKQFKPVNCRSP